MTSRTQAALFAAWLRQKRLRLAILFVGVLVPLYVFGAFAEDVVEKEPFAFDGAIMAFLHSHATPALDAAMLSASLAGSATILTPVALAVALVLFARKRVWALYFWCLSATGAVLINLLAKHSFARMRPDLWLSIAPEVTYSFPSGHAMQTMALSAAAAALVWHTAWRWPLIAASAAFVLLVGVSRVYLGVHFPSDILAGWAASLGWVLGLYSSLFTRLARPKLARASA